jgi:hypothetical protein
MALLSGFFLKKKPLSSMVSVYTNPEDAIDFKQGFVSGHDFSRAISVSKSTGL